MSNPLDGVIDQPETCPACNEVVPDHCQCEVPLNDLHAALLRYVILPSDVAVDAVTLWITATHAQTAWEVATRLVITAPEKRCGKSRLLDIIEATCHNALTTVNISPAALVRSIGKNPPTLLLDEADTVFGKKAADNHEDLRGILNAGHQRNRPYVRWDATARRPEHCATFAMAALAGIGSMPDTIEDRAVMIRMRRRAPGETVQPYRTRRDAPPLHALRSRLAAWVRGRHAELANAEPDMPVEDRAADNWESLIAIADLAGGNWPKRARTACEVLSGTANEDTTIGVRLLADLHVVFEDADALHGTTILNRLHKLDESPWGDWYGRLLNANDLAKILKPYGVRSTKVKVAGQALQGYRRDDLHDPWSRYLPRQGEGGTSGTCGTAQVRDPNEIRGSGGSGHRTYPEPNAPPLTCEVPQVPEVPDTPPTGGSTPVGTCSWCGEPLDEPGQTTHPECGAA